MRAFVFAFIAFFVFLPVFSVRAADYSNDSNAININYTGSAPDTGGTSSSGASGQAAGDTGAGGTGGSTGTQSAGSTDVTVPVVVVTGGTSGGQSSGGGGGTSSGGGILGGTTGAAGAAQGTTGTSGGSASSGGVAGGLGGSVSASDILSTLQGNQAIIFSGGASASGSAGGGGLSGADAFGTVTLSGKKVRDALFARSVSDIILGSALGQKYLTKGDAAIAAASAILKNSAIEEVVLSLQTISLTYTAEGRLFAVFPMNYPLKVTVNPNGVTTDERVKLSFPWYSFFLQTFVSQKTLQAKLDAAVLSVTADVAGSVDGQSRLLAAVNEVLENTLIR